MAYEGKIVKVKTHSTRAMGPTWTLYNGISMKSNLEVADWSKESTFVKLYLRNVDTKVLKQERNYHSGWLPMEEAFVYNHTTCILGGIVNRN